MFRHYLSRTGFHRQLTVIVSAAILGLAVFSSLMNSWETSDRMRDYFIGQGQRIADNLARQSTLALLFHSAENARDVVASTLAFPDVMGLQISNAKHEVLLSRVQHGAVLDPAIRQPLQLAHADLLKETGDAWLFAAPVYGGQANSSPFDMQESRPQLIGYVHVQVGKDTLKQLTRSLLLGNLAITLSFAVILLLLVGYLTRNLINPLNALSQLMRRARQGESGMRATPAGPRDLVEMGNAFNQMMNVLEQREAAAVNMAQMKAQFAATVSHEVRTPLNGVVGMLDMLKEMRLTQRQQECVDVAWNSSRTLIELINNILDFSKMEAGKLAVEETEYDLRKLLEEAIELVARPAQQKGIDLAYVLAPDVPERIIGDALRLRQILINLLGNAVKFTDHGEVALRVSRAPRYSGPTASGTLAEGAYALHFEVRDSGIGMSVEAQNHLFESYVQPDPSSTRRFGGTGLGLAICRQLVRLLGGQISVTSVAGAGTTFTFSILCQPGKSQAASHTHPALAGVPVLVVERSPVLREFLQDVLVRHALRCYATPHGSDALAELKAASAAGNPYRVAILDIGATDDHGNDLACRIEAAGLETQLLVLDRFGPPGGGTTIGGHVTLGKPLRQQRLLQALHDMLGARPGHEASPHAPLPRTPARQFRVLVAEDNRTNQMVAAGMLAMNGCLCEFAADGRQAVAAAQRQQFDLILMDCSMPEMDGYEATARIRLMEEALGRRTPLVAMTANTQRGDAEKCLAAGMDDYLAKPITLVELRQKLDRWLPQGETALPAHAAPASELAAAPVARALAVLEQNGPLDRAVFDKLREILGATLPHAITPYLEDTPVYLDELEAAIASGDLEMARARAHAIKGSSGNFGATELSSVAQQAENYAMQQRLPLIAPLLPHLRALYAEVAAFLSREIDASTAAASGNDDTPQVLVVDDDRSTRSTLRYTLQRDGFRVEEAADGAEALALLKRFQPDVILMDAVMPVMDGFAACARLQELPGGSAIPVLMITALQDNSSVERAFAAGASDYIPKPIHYAVLSQRVRRIIEANRAEKRIRHLAYNDVLTGLPNRTLFFDLLGKSIEAAAQAGTQVGVLFMDLDRFKYVNDNLGHPVGDRLLQAVAQRVRHTVRTVDTVARLGGDEFTVVLGDLDSPAAAATAAHNICRMLATPFQIDGHDIFVTSSVGIAMYPHDGTDVATLVKHADSAMYRAKKTNTGFQFYEASMEHSISEHVRMESDLRRALEQGQLEVFYQPQASMQTGEIIGMEALIRWIHPSRGNVGPNDFIGLAEETGLIIPLGEWVLRTACAQLQQWLQQGLPPMRVAVNLSVRQLLQKDFAATVEAILHESGLPPQLLELEITESTLMEHAQDTLAALHRLHQLGVRLSIDDFGTGYSSLSYLKRFPVDIIKIDRSFVRDVPQDSDDAAIVTAIIALAHSLRLEVVAEGVETEAQLRFLQARRCDLLQGHHLSPAIPAEQFARLVRTAISNREITS